MENFSSRLDADPPTFSGPIFPLVCLPAYLCACRSGADYMVPSKVEEYQRLIRRKLGQRLEYCSGNVVVLFDELQKAAPGTLDGEAGAGTRGRREGAVRIGPRPNTTKRLRSSFRWPSFSRYTKPAIRCFLRSCLFARKKRSLPVRPALSQPVWLLSQQGVSQEASRRQSGFFNVF